VGVRFVGGELGPLVGNFVALDSLVAWAPPDLDPCVWFLGSEGGDMPPGFEGVFLPCSTLIYYGMVIRIGPPPPSSNLTLN